MSTNDALPLSDRVVAITGAGRGIGSATATLLASRGAVVVAAARSESELSTLTQRISAGGGRASYVVADVTHPDDVRAVVARALHDYGRLDAFVNNAGVAINAPLASGDLADWNTMIDVNLRGVLHGIAAALPHFVEQRSGHIVTVASTSAYKWVPNQGVYAATKSAVRALAEVLRQECAGTGVRATLVSPGFTDTDFIASTRDPAELRELTARRDAIAMPPDAVARAIAYALEEPDDVDVGEIVVRSSAQP